MIKTAVHEGPAGFRALETDWRRLESAGGATIFQSWDWCDCRLSADKDAVPMIVTAGSGGAIETILPLSLSKQWYGFPVRRLSFIGTGPADYGGPIGDYSGALDRLTGALAGGAYDLIDLHQVDRDLAKNLAEALGSGHKVTVFDQEPTYAADISEGLNAYLAGLGKKFRKNAVYADRRLRREFEFEIRTPDSPGEDVSVLMDQFFRLHQRRWIRKRMPGMFLLEENKKFHLKLARRLAASGRLVLEVLYLDREPAAAFYGFKMDKNISYYLGGFDPEWSKYSVSTVLVFNILKDACGRGFRRFDFLRGQEDYKRRWQARETPLFRVVASKAGLRGRLGALIARRENNLVQRARDHLHN